MCTNGNPMDTRKPNPCAKNRVRMFRSMMATTTLDSSLNKIHARVCCYHRSYKRLTVRSTNADICE